jgi:GAF domain-containing protein
VERELREAEVRRKRRYAEKQLGKINRSLRTIVRCNRALFRATEESAFLNEICRIIVGDGGYRMAWIGLAEETDRKRVRPAACAGHEEGYLTAVDITWDNNKSGRNPVGAAIRTGRIWTDDMITLTPSGQSRQEETKRGYASSIALPLVLKKRPFGALAIYSSQRGAFSDEEKELLRELADDVSFGVMTLRMRKQ